MGKRVQHEYAEYAADDELTSRAASRPVLTRRPRPSVASANVEH